MRPTPYVPVYDGSDRVWAKGIGRRKTAVEMSRRNVLIVVISIVDMKREECGGHTIIVNVFILNRCLSFLENLTSLGLDNRRRTRAAAVMLTR